MYMDIFHTCVSVLPTALRGKEITSDPLKLEFKMVVSSHVGSGNSTWIL